MADRFNVRGGDKVKMAECKGEKRMYASERDAMIGLAVLAQIADSLEKNLGERSKMVKGLPREMGLLKYCASAVLTHMLQTVPDVQLHSLIHNLHDSVYTTGVRSARGKKDDSFGMWISFDDLNVISEKLTHECCLVCTEENGCKLRGVLDRIGCDVEHDGPHCGYRMI